MTEDRPPLPHGLQYGDIVRQGSRKDDYVVCGLNPDGSLVVHPDPHGTGNGVRSWRPETVKVRRPGPRGGKPKFHPVTRQEK